MSPSYRRREVFEAWQWEGDSGQFPAWVSGAIVDEFLVLVHKRGGVELYLDYPSEITRDNRVFVPVGGWLVLENPDEGNIGSYTTEEFERLFELVED